MWQYYNLLFFDPHKHVLSLSLFYSIYSYSIHLQPQNCTERGSSSLTSVLLGERVFQLGTIIQYVRVHHLFWVVAWMSCVPPVACVRGPCAGYIRPDDRWRRWGWGSERSSRPPPPHHHHPAPGYCWPAAHAPSNRFIRSTHTYVTQYNVSKKRQLNHILAKRWCF